MNNTILLGFSAMLVAVAFRQLWAADPAGPHSQTQPAFERTGWNSKAKQVFEHPPTFTFSAVPGATGYRCTLAGGKDKVVVESQTPNIALAPAWAKLPTTGTFQATCEAIAQDGQPLGTLQFTMTRKAPFAGLSLPRKSEYAASGLNCARFMMDTLSGKRPELRELCVRPGVGGGWPGLFYPAQMRLLAAYARLGPATQADEAMADAKTFTDWLIDRNSPADWRWPNCPPTSHVNKHDGSMYIQPSRLGLIGEAYLDMLAVKKDARVLDAAMKLADTLKANQLPDGRWPFRVNPRTGGVVTDYTSDQAEVITFLERLIADHGRQDLQGVVDKAVQWTLKNPCEDFRWQGQYDDMGEFAPYKGLEWYDTGFVILYLLRHADKSNGYVPKAEELLRYIEDQFIDWGFSATYVTPSAKEQYSCYEYVDYSVAHYIRICMGFHQATGDATYLKKAEVMANTLTNLQNPAGWYACQNARHVGAGKLGVIGEIQWKEYFGINFLPNCSAYAGEMLLRLAEYQSKLKGQGQ